MLVGILALVFLSQKATGDLTFDLVSLAEGQSVAENTARWLFLAFAASFAIKCPIFPVHTWLPDAHTEAPTGGSVILAGVLLKLGTYGFLRFGLYLFPTAAVDLAPVFLTLGVIGIIYGALVATMQKDLKRLVAYSSVAHLGFIVVGHRSASPPRACRAACCRWSTTASPPAPSSSWWGWSTSAATPASSPSMGGIQKSAPVLRRRLHRGHALVDRPARAQRLRGRVPGPASARSSPTAGGRWWPPSG